MTARGHSAPVTDPGCDRIITTPYRAQCRSFKKSAHSSYMLKPSTLVTVCCSYRTRRVSRRGAWGLERVCSTHPRRTVFGYNRIPLWYMSPL